VSQPDRPGLVTLGETMGLISASGIGRLEAGAAFTYGIGGAESNVAIGMARLGARATWMGRLGRDATGDMIERRLAAEGVRVFAARDAGYTGLMVRHQRRAGAVAVDYHRAGSAGSLLRPDDLVDEAFAGAGIVHLTGITPALSSTARDTVTAAIERAGHAGIPISFDVNYRRKLWSPQAAAPVLRALAASAGLIFAGVEEAELILGRTGTSEDLARALADLGPAQAVIKDGARGATAMIDGRAYRVPALAVPVIDPVGAGDAFVAGYLTEQLDGGGPADRLRTAVAAGAYAVGVPGDCEGLPTREELLALDPDADVSR
jgi:2-dehydro-3-deoxygluconokinase